MQTDLRIFGVIWAKNVAICVIVVGLALRYPGVHLYWWALLSAALYFAGVLGLITHYRRKRANPQ